MVPSIGNGRPVPVKAKPLGKDMSHSTLEGGFENHGLTAVRFDASAGVGNHPASTYRNSCDVV